MQSRLCGEEGIMANASHRQHSNAHSIREGLLARRQELSARRQQLEADRRRQREPLTTDAPDRAIQLQNDDVVDSIESSVEEELRNIEAALQRVDSGHYGQCQTCGGSIEDKRLIAVPYAVECQSCAAQANS
jgi:RNA polymerase-binding transcription factor DksA